MPPELLNLPLPELKDLSSGQGKGLLRVQHRYQHR